MDLMKQRESTSLETEAMDTKTSNQAQETVDDEVMKKYGVDDDHEEIQTEARDSMQLKENEATHIDDKDAEADCTTKVVATRLTLDSESREAEKSLQATEESDEVIPQSQVPISVWESRPGDTWLGVELIQANRNPDIENVKSQLFDGLNTGVWIVQHNEHLSVLEALEVAGKFENSPRIATNQCAYQLFEQMLTRGKTEIQQRIVRKLPKSWKFKYKLKKQSRFRVAGLICFRDLHSRTIVLQNKIRHTKNLNWKELLVRYKHHFSDNNLQRILLGKKRQNQKIIVIMCFLQQNGTLKALRFLQQTRDVILSPQNVLVAVEFKMQHMVLWPPDFGNKEVAKEIVADAVNAYLLVVYGSYVSMLLQSFRIANMDSSLSRNLSYVLIGRIDFEQNVALHVSKLEIENQIVVWRPWSVHVSNSALLLCVIPAPITLLMEKIELLSLLLLNQKDAVKIFWWLIHENNSEVDEKPEFDKITQRPKAQNLNKLKRRNLSLSLIFWEGRENLLTSVFMGIMDFGKTVALSQLLHNFMLLSAASQIFDSRSFSIKQLRTRKQELRCLKGGLKKHVTVAWNEGIWISVQQHMIQGRLLLPSYESTEVQVHLSINKESFLIKDSPTVERRIYFAVWPCWRKKFLQNNGFLDWFWLSDLMLLALQIQVGQELYTDKVVVLLPNGVCFSIGILLGDYCMETINAQQRLLLITKSLLWILNLAATVTNIDKYLMQNKIYQLLVQRYMQKTAAQRRNSTNQGLITVNKGTDKIIFLTENLCSAKDLMVEPEAVTLDAEPSKNQCGIEESWCYKAISLQLEGKLDLRKGGIDMIKGDDDRLLDKEVMSWHLQNKRRREKQVRDS